MYTGKKADILQAYFPTIHLFCVCVEPITYHVIFVDAYLSQEKFFSLKNSKRAIRSFTSNYCTKSLRYMVSQTVTAQNVYR